MLSKTRSKGKMERKMKEQRKKRRQQVLIVVVMFGLGLVLQWQNQRTKPGAVLIRGDPGTGQETQTWEVNVPGVIENYDMDIDVSERKLTKKEAEKLLQQALKEMQTSFLKKGQELSHITQAIFMKDTYAGGMVKAEWSYEQKEKEMQEAVEDRIKRTREDQEEKQDVVIEEAQDVSESQPEPIDDTGLLNEAAISKNGLAMEFQVVLRYDRYVLRHSFAGVLSPRELDAKEKALYEIKQQVEKSLGETGEQKKVTLPERADQKQVIWKQKGEDKPYPIIFMVVGIAGAIGLELKEAEQKRKDQQAREEQLRLDYPDFVSQMVLLMGAGMNMDGVFRRMGENYRLQRKRGTMQRHEVYELVLQTTQEIHDGLGDVRAYERFGERCAIPEYRRLASYISQNLRKGTKALGAILEKEAQDALLRRKNMAHKYAQEAGTKLVFPMMLMLMMLMAIIMIAGFMQV